MYRMSSLRSSNCRQAAGTSGHAFSRLKHPACLNFRTLRYILLLTDAIEHSPSPHDCATQHSNPEVCASGSRSLCLSTSPPSGIDPLWDPDPRRSTLGVGVEAIGSACGSITCRSGAGRGQGGWIAHRQDPAGTQAVAVSSDEDQHCAVSCSGAALDLLVSVAELLGRHDRHSEEMC